MCVCWCVQSLVSLEQGGSISLGTLETQLELLLENTVASSPPGNTHPHSRTHRAAIEE